MMLRVVGLVVTWVVVGACAAPDEPVQSSVDVPLVSPSGQGQDHQGIDYDGLDYQGLEYQGTELAGADLVGGPLVDGSVDGTALIAWRLVGSGKTATWEQLFPHKICSWNFLRNNIPSCVDVDLSIKASPLAGSTWPATFVDENGQTTRVTFKIGVGVGRVFGAVRKDTELAMHAMQGASTCTLDHGASCGNANGCRANCDLWLYDVKVDVDGQLRNLCPPGERAYAIDGTYDATGEHTTANGRFTFACTTGTIAKCTRWGYRPFGSALRCNEQQDCESEPTELAPYHQACVRAATADYCANGRSFTKNGTLIDIWDYMPYDPNNPERKGFVPRTSMIRWHAGGLRTDALVYESTFDRHGASELDNTRYNDLGSIWGLGGCSNRFDLALADTDGTLLRPYWRRPPPHAPAHTPPYIGVDSTPRCAHSEHTLGAPLHLQCSPCTRDLWLNHRDEYSKCNTTAWDADCKQVTTQGKDGIGPCQSGDRMTGHSECTIGPALQKYGSGCTLRICLDPALASCCVGTWTAACVAAANARCTGGQESTIPPRGFCGNSLPTQP